MISKSVIKHIQSLRLKKFRQKYDLFVVEGDKSVSTLIAQDRLQLNQLFASSDWIARDDTGVNTRSAIDCTKEELKRLSLLQSTPDVIGVFEIPEPDERLIDKVQNVIYLDAIQDPGNLGTIIRIADWYGVDMVVRSPDSADFYNPKVVQSTMGSIGHVALETISQVDFKTAFDGFARIGASLSGDVTSVNKAHKTCLVIGNEGHGLSHEVNSNLSARIKIPGAQNKRAESLNAGVATGILCQMIFGESLN